MTLNLLFSAPEGRWASYRNVLPRACDAAGLDVNLSRDTAPGDVDYVVYAPNDTMSDFAPFTRAKAVLSLWAGVEKIISNETLTQPLTRMVDPGLREGMRDYIVGHVMRYHLGMDAHINNPDRLWVADAPPLARHRRVGILGLGELGAFCASALSELGFDVAGWSRREKTLTGVTTYAGEDGLREILSRSEILVLLLPSTPQTENLFSAEAFARLPRGARIINPGRGALIDDDALLAALAAGRVAHATLDVFRQEPLPRDHPFWSEPRITVTPHIASETRPETASEVIAQNIKRSEAGEPLLYLVDRSAGY
ncbi:glyoxylate/hydroxypyruvate reductase A [Celeribacter arenosi]|uniref:Glyoxylate/hydroxypyruvate reductase A n=1 Tax=Celeribacter arenosi TaxID=792649 RepID=A0ABP7K6Q7_9RHOB